MTKLVSLDTLARRQDDALRRKGYLTFEGWKARDRIVVKGEHAEKWNSHGMALFREDQTTGLNRGNDFDDPYEYDWCNDDWGDR